MVKRVVMEAGGWVGVERVKGMARMAAMSAEGRSRAGGGEVCLMALGSGPVGCSGGVVGRGPGWGEVRSGREIGTPIIV